MLRALPTVRQQIGCERRVCETEFRDFRRETYDSYMGGHIFDHDLERYYLGMISEEAELAPLEEHLLWCESCQDRCNETEQYIDALQSSLIQNNVDLEV